MIDAEAGHDSSVFDQCCYDEGRDLSLVQRRPIAVAQPRIARAVVDDDGLAARERVAYQLIRHYLSRLPDERRDVARVLAANDVLAALDFRVGDAGDAKVLPEETRGRLLNVTGVTEGPKRVVEPQQKLQLVLVCAELSFGLAVLE